MHRGRVRTRPNRPPSTLPRTGIPSIDPSDVSLSAAEHSWLFEGPRKESGTARFFAWILPFVERLNRACSKVPNVAVFDNQTFPWTREIEREWQTIRLELERIMLRKDELPGFEEILPDLRSVTRDRGWKSLILTGMGIRSKSISLCPQTWRIVNTIPGLSSAMFSIFEPGTHLPPHRGPYNGVLRLHLGLVVPVSNDEVAIRVGSDVRHWEEGRVLVFDDSYEHEAWNNSERPRVVLFVDFLRPMRFPANVVNALLLKASTFSLFVREARDNQRRWERNFFA